MIITALIILLKTAAFILSVLAILLLLILVLPIDYSGLIYSDSEGTGAAVKVRLLLGLIQFEYDYPDELSALRVLGFRPQFLIFDNTDYFGEPPSKMKKIPSKLKKIWKHRILIWDLMKLVPGKIRGFIKAFRLLRVEADVRLDVSDPAMSGMLSGYGYAVSGVIEGLCSEWARIRILPAPENTCTRGKAKFEGRIWPFLLIWSIISFLLSAPVRWYIINVGIRGKDPSRYRLLCHQ